LLGRNRPVDVVQNPRSFRVANKPLNVSIELRYDQVAHLGITMNKQFAD
jgi:hypothetical protein